jgi:hypothetical protein
VGAPWIVEGPGELSVSLFEQAKDVEVPFVVRSRYVLDERFQFREDALAKPLEGKLP